MIKMEINYDEILKIGNFFRKMVSNMEIKAKNKRNPYHIYQHFNKINIRNLLEFASKTINTSGYQTFLTKWNNLKKCNNPAITKNLNTERIEYFNQILEFSDKLKDIDINTKFRIFIALYLNEFNKTKEKYNPKKRKRY